MEIPIIYRETRARVEFVGRIKKDVEAETLYFKYPGGEVPIINEIDFAKRLAAKGFGVEEVEELLELFCSTVSTEAAVSASEVLERVG